MLIFDCKNKEREESVLSLIGIYKNDNNIGQSFQER